MLASLPAELILQLARHLAARDILTLSATGRSFRSLYWDESLWAALANKDYLFPRNRFKFATLTPAYRYQLISNVNKSIGFSIDKGTPKFNKEALRSLLKSAEAIDDILTIKIIYSCLNMSKLDDNELARLLDANYVNFVRLILTDNGLKFKISNDTFIKAIKTGRDDIVELLLKVGGIDPSCYRNKAIRIACKNDYLRVFEVLLRDPRVQPGDAIIIAAKRGHTDIVDRLLRDSRVDPTINSYEALYLAAKNNHPETYRALASDPRLRHLDVDFMWQLIRADKDR